MARRSPNKPRRWDVVVIPEWCKGCVLCVEICPTGVLEMDVQGLLAEVVDLDACTGCRLCEMMCPDFAVEVHDVQTDEDREPETSGERIPESG
jgi:2-oxoglutarate ferredoxin oxidoreductase subunit delta